MKPTEIVKVQLPLAAPGSDYMPELALIYGEGGERRQLRRLTDAERSMMGKRLMAYFRATFENDTWQLVARVRTREW